MIRALLFDLGNVLVHFDHDRMFRQIGELVNRTGAEVESLLRGSGLFARVENTPMTREQMHYAMEDLFATRMDRDRLYHAVSDMFWRNESMEPIVARLAGAGWPLVLVSNTCDAHFQWVAEHFPVVRYFEKRILSFQVGAAKPAAEIFHAASRAANTPPEHCFFVDDTAGHVEAARQLQFDAAVYRDTPRLLSDLALRGIDLDQSPPSRQTQTEARES